MRRVRQSIIATTLFAVGSFIYAQAADVSPAKDDTKAPTPAKAPVAKKDTKLRLPLSVTPEREAAVATFVERNHPELQDLLLYLKSSQSDEYQRAIKEIFRTTERLALIQERDPLQYELEVAAWQAQSRVQLLAAKIQMDSNEELALRLREALRLQNDARLALLKHERQKAADRLAKCDSDIARFQRDREAIIDRQFKLLRGAAADNRASEKRPAKLNAKSSPKPTKKKS